MEKSNVKKTTAEDARAHAKAKSAIVYPPEGQQFCGQPNCAYFDAKARSMRDYRIRFLYDEYKQACDREGLVALMPSSFSTKLAKWRRDEAVGKAPAWFPGELMQTYWTRISIGVASGEGEGGEIVGAGNGGTVSTSSASVRGGKGAGNTARTLPMFVAYLPFSGLSYLRVCEDQSFMSWMRCCAAAYRYMGGVPHVTEYWRAGEIPEQRTGDSQHATLQAFAAHYRTVLLHPRPKGEAEPSERLKPLVLKRYTAASKYVRDNMAAAEGATVESLDQQARALSEAYNQAHHGLKPSIMEAFRQQEAPQLLTLPVRDYDMAVWAERRADASYHFDQDKVRYSVPWRYAWEPVRVRIAENTIQAYSMGELIAEHGIPASPAGKAIVTDPAHRPPEQRGFANRLEDRFMALALDSGPATGAIMREIVLQCKREGGCWRPCKDLLDLARTPSGIRLEEACALVLERDMPLSTESAAQVMRESTR